jgi:tRNA-Thr(GGU) m(6)t(6)A37 methyltransferase TsaA
MEATMEFIMRPIGVVHTPFSDKDQMPIQAARSQALGLVHLYPEFVEGLQDLEGFTHIHLLYVFHASATYALLVKPFLDDQMHGLFATRHPCRPNPIGLSVVRLLAHKDELLEVQGVDMLDGTPVLDIKPYVPDFDLREDVRTGWYEQRSIK